MSRELSLNESNYDLCADLLDFQKDQPTVIAYARSAYAPQRKDLPDPLETQRNLISDKLRSEFGDNFRVIWICEVGSGTRGFRDDSGQCRPGLRLAAKLVETGLVKHVCVTDLSRISRNLLVHLEFVKLLSEHGATLMTVEPVSESLEGCLLRDARTMRVRNCCRRLKSILRRYNG